METLIGKKINNRFVLEQIIDRGGVGCVFKALDLRKQEANNSNPYIAIKVLNKELSNFQGAIELLEQEASKTQSLKHPNIVGVNDFDRDGDITYITMELLEGQTLRKLLNSKYPNGMPYDKALSIIKVLADTLTFAHKQGITHRDFKPENIYILDESHDIRILDFGISKKETAVSGEESQISFDAISPSYSSFEMFYDFQPMAVDDVYSFACVSYEMLTGKHPFNGTKAPEGKRIGLKIEPLAGLTKKQNQAFEHALAWERSNRTETINDFFQNLSETPKSSKGSGWLVFFLLFIPLAIFASVYVNSSLNSFDRLIAYFTHNATKGEKQGNPEKKQEELESSHGQQASTAQSLEIPEHSPKITKPEITAQETSLPAAQEEQKKTEETFKTRQEITKPTKSQAIQPEFVQPEFVQSELVQSEQQTAIELSENGDATIMSVASSEVQKIAQQEMPIEKKTESNENDHGIKNQLAAEKDNRSLPITFYMGSTPEEIDKAFQLCQQYAENCDRSWYASELYKKVELPPFVMDKYEVSVREFAEFVNQTGYKTDVERRGFSYLWDGKKMAAVTGYTWKTPHGPKSSYRQNPNFPVVNITRDDANAFCRNKGARLPSIEEWEYTARGLKKRLYPWGDFWMPSNLNYNSNTLVAVDSMPEGATPEGVYHLAGNVWEWTRSKAAHGYYLKGGSYLERNPASFRAATSRIETASSSSPDDGFRCSYRVKSWPNQNQK